MTTVVTMQDPAAVLGREISKIEPGKTIADIVPEIMPHFDPRYTSVFLNNVKINTPVISNGEVIERGDEATMTMPLAENDVVVIVNEPKGISIGALLVTSLVAAAITYLMIPSIPGNEAKQSSNNQLYGQRNSARPYDAIPDIYGTVVSYPDLIAPEEVLYYVGNQPQIKQFMCVGVGHYDIPADKIKLGGTPIGLIPGATVDIHEPDEDGFTYIPDFEYHTSVPEVNGIELVGLGDASYNVSCTVDYDDVTDTLSITANDSSFSFSETLSSGDEVEIATVGISGTYNVTSVSGDNITIDDASTYQSDWLSTDQADFPAQSDVYISRPEQLTEIGPYDTVAPGTGFVLDIKYPRGLVNRQVEITVTYWQITKPGGSIIAGPFEKTVTHSPINFVFFDLFGVEFGDKTYDQQDRSIVINATTEEYPFPKYFRVQVRRNGETSANPEEPDLAKWTRLASISSSRLLVQGVTLVELNLPGTKAAISPRENNLNMEVTRKTVSYDLDAGEIVYELSPSDSFADAVLHEYTQVFRRPVSGLDLDELYQIKKRLDDNNPSFEPFEGNFSFTFDDIDVGLGERLETICTAARVRTYRDGTIWRFTREEVKPVSGIITRKDISSDRQYSKTWKPRMPSESDGVRVEYTDPNTNKKAYVYRSFSNGEIVVGPGVNNLDVKLAGCRNILQAKDRADLEIRRMLYEGYIITDTLLIEGNMYDIGQVVEYADVYREDISDGEIIDFDGNDVITMSEEIDMPATAYISFTGAFGEVYGPFNCTRLVAGVGPTNKVRVIEGESFDDVKGEIFTSNGSLVQLGSRFVISTEQSQSPGKFVINSKEPNNNGTVQLTMTQYDERIFERTIDNSGGGGGGGRTDGIFLPIFDPICEPVPPDTFKKSEHLYDGQYGLSIHASVAPLLTDGNYSSIIISPTGKIYGTEKMASDFEVLDGPNENPFDGVFASASSLDGNKVIAMVQSEGVGWFSSDGGLTWTKIANYEDFGLPSAGVNRFPVSSKAGEAVFFTAMRGGYISKFGSAYEFTPVETLSPTTPGNYLRDCTSIVFGVGGVFVTYEEYDTNDSFVGIAAFRGSSSGSFSQIPSDLGIPGGSSPKFIDAANSGPTVVAVLDSPYSTFGDYRTIAVSTDGGSNFDRVTIPYEEFSIGNNTDIGVVNSSGDMILVGSTSGPGDLLYSTDEGLTWSLCSYEDGVDPAPGVDAMSTCDCRWLVVCGSSVYHIN